MMRGGRSRGRGGVVRGGPAQPGASSPSPATRGGARGARGGRGGSTRGGRGGNSNNNQQSSRDITQQHDNEDSIFDSEIGLLTQSEFFKNLQLKAFDMLDSLQLREKKLELINIVSSSLIKEPRFNKVTPVLENIITGVYQISHYDPEFVHKLALYTRTELGIRTVANYLMSLASVIPQCQPYLKKYYSSSIRLPSDWLEVPNIVSKLVDSNSIPKSLRNVMVDKFTDFDTYQLGKYNTEGKIKRNRKKLKKSIKNNPEDKEKLLKEYEEKQTGSLKQMIRILHISQPSYSIMCILGKKYPTSYEDYVKLRLPGDYEPDRAGKRMRLPIPETWETMLSEKGNKAQTWQDLIDNKKLPFMAMLRNLRNLLITGVHPRVHDQILRMLRNRNTIAQHQTFPMQFLAAYNSIPTDGVQIKKLATDKKVKIENFPSQALLDDYREALDTAIKLSTIVNVKPIRGTTVVFVYVGEEAKQTCSTNRSGKYSQLESSLLLGLMCKYVCEECDLVIIGEAKNGGNSSTPYLYHVSNESSISNAANPSNTKEEEEDDALASDSILKKMATIKEIISHHFNESGSMNKFPTQYIMDMILEKKRIDNLLILNHSTVQLDSESYNRNILTKYRQQLNNDLLYVSINLSGKQAAQPLQQHPNDVYISGFSDSILKFIAERGGADQQLQYIEKIDEVKKLKSINVSQQSTNTSTSTATTQQVVLKEEKKIVQLVGVPRNNFRPWKNIRIFISSTFLDMHGERDQLIKYVFPELRERCIAKRIHLTEVDLRWGITEDEAQKNRSVELCLDEVDRCRPFFIGLLGQRYGWVPPMTYKIADEPRYDWLKTYPKNRSITELEMHHAAFNAQVGTSTHNCLFYIRDHTQLAKDIPKEYRAQFETEDKESSLKLEALKTKIRNNSRFYTYQAGWGGLVDGKPQVNGLEEFHDRVLEDLWERIQAVYPDIYESDEELDTMEEENNQQQIQQDIKCKRFVGRKDEINCLFKFCEVAKLFGTSNKVSKLNVSANKSGIIMVTGKGGSGKTALLANFIQQLLQNRQENQHKYKNQPPLVVVSHFIGSTITSTNIVAALHRICYQIIKQAELTNICVTEIPTDYKQLKLYLQLLIKQASSKVKLVIVIDALDQLEAKFGAKSLDWLPAVTLPARVIVSCADGDHSISILKRRKIAPLDLAIDAMDNRDGQVLVQAKLADYRKKLDDSATNNQMRMLLSKSDASNPLYLVLACEELRLFGGFEELSDKIKSLSPTLAILFQDILNRLEQDNGRNLVQSVFGAIACSRIGLTEKELRVLAARKELNEQQLPIGLWSKFYRSIQSLVTVNADQTIEFFHHQLLLAVQKKYLSLGDSSERIHKLLASYYQSLADPKGNYSFVGADSKAISEVAHHLVLSKQMNLVEETLCNLNYIETKSTLGMTFQLVNDYLEALGDEANKVDTATSGSMSSAKLKLKQSIDNIKDFYRMVSSNSHILARSPELTFQQSINQPNRSHAHRLARKQVNTVKKSWIEWQNKTETRESCRQTLDGFGDGGTTAVCYSPNGQLLAVAGHDGSIRILVPSSGLEVHVLSGVHTSYVTSLSFSKDSKMLASGGRDEKVAVWDVVVGSVLHVFEGKVGHDRAVNCVRFSPLELNILLTVGWDGRAIIWNVSTKSFVKNINAHDKPINHCAWSKDGTTFATTGWDATIRIWKPFDQLNQQRRLRYSNILDVSTTIKGSLKSCEFAPNGKQIIATAMDGSVLLFDISSSKLLSRLGQHGKSANYCSFSDDGQHFVSASDDSTIKIWTPTLGCELGKSRIEGEGWANCMAYSKQFGILAMGCSDCVVRLYEVNGGNIKLITSLQGHSRAIHSVAFSHDEKLLASTAEDKSIIVWSVPNRQLSYRIDNAHNELINAVAFSPSHGSNILISCSDDFTTKVWDGKRLVTTLSSNTNTVKHCCFSPNGKYIATVSRDCSITLYLAATYKELCKLTGHTDWINFVTFSADSKRLISGGWDFNIKVWSMNSRKELVTMRGHVGSIEKAFFTNDGDYIISCGFDGCVKVWDPEFGNEITSLTHESRISDVVQTNDGTGRIFSCSDDGIVKCWNPIQGQCITTLTGHANHVNQATFLPSGSTSSGSSSFGSSSNANQTFTKTIGSSSLDGNVKIWEFSNATVDQSTASLTQSTSPVVGISYSFDGSKIACIRQDHTLQIFDAKSHHCIKSLQVSDSTPTAIAFTKGGQLVVGKQNGELSIYQDPTSSTPKCESYAIHKQKVTAITPLRYHNTFASGSWDRVVQVWNEAGGAQEYSATLTTTPDWIETVVFSPDGEMIAIGGRDRNFTICRPSLSTTTHATLFETEFITSMAFSPDSKLLAIGTYNGDVEIYNPVDETHSQVFTQQRGSISALTFIDNTRLVSVSKDHSLIIWNLQTNEIENEFIHNSPVTCLEFKNNKLVTGDSNGNLYFLNYHAHHN